MVSALTLLFALGVPSRVASQSPAPSPFTCETGGLAALDPEIRVNPMNDPPYAVAWVAYFDALALRYPAGAYAREIRRVTLVRDLTYKGTAVGGLAYWNSREIVLCVDRGGAPLSAGDLVSGFHHETAHCLFDRYASGVFRNVWKLANASDAPYHHVDGFEALGAQDFGTTIDPALCAKGYLHPYAASCETEDVACVGGSLIADDASEAEGGVRDLCRRFPRLAAKFSMARDLYRRVFPTIVLTDLPKTPGPKSG